MNWKQLLIKKIIMGRVPCSDKMRRIKRKIFGYFPNHDHIDTTIKNYDKIKFYLKKTNGSLENLTILEIGSGWFPIIPILMLRDGAKKIYMSDLNVHMDDITFAATKDFLKKRYPDDEFLKSIGDFKSLEIEYLAPFNSNILKNKSLDVVFSHAVLEHIPKSSLYNLFFDIKSKIKNEGIMIHIVDHSDHFEHYDKSISRINFLTWSEEMHALINYMIKDGENRMRHHEYHQIFLDAGFNVVDEETYLDQKTLNEIQNLKLVYPYSKMSNEQLAILTSIYVIKQNFYS